MKDNNVGFKYNNIEKKNKNFMYNNLKRSNCYNCDFTGSNFNYVSFRGAHMKSSDFYGCTFKEAEFIGANLKKSKFRAAKFDGTIFEGVNLEGCEFKDAVFKNTIFLNTDLSVASGLNLKAEGIRVFDEMPEVEISPELEGVLTEALSNKIIKDSRTLDDKNGKINPLIVMILLEKFSEKILISGLKRFTGEINKEFCTLSYITRTIQSYVDGGLI
ncbi:MAG: pentapeptide repeat-containing protein [Clostridium sp.]